MKIIGLTGSIAMGKSEVAKIFREQGFPVFDADAEVHALYDSQEGAELLQHEAPEATRNGKVDRKQLSALVFKNPALLEKLEKKVHARIRARRERFLSSCADEGSVLAVVDVPLLFETGGEKDVDLTVVVSAPQEMQRKRALARPGMTEERLAMILKRQMPDSEKRKRASFIIENNGSLGDLKNQVLNLIKQIQSGHS